MTDTVWTIIHRLLLDNSKRIAEAQLAGTHEEYSAIINGVSAHIAGKVEELQEAEMGEGMSAKQKPSKEGVSARHAGAGALTPQAARHAGPLHPH